MSHRFIAYDRSLNEKTDFYAYLDGEGDTYFNGNECGLKEDSDIVICFETGKLSVSGQMVYEDDIVSGKRESHWHSGQDLIKGTVFYSKEHCAYHVKSEGEFAGGELFDIEELTVIGHKKYTNEEEF